MKRYTAIVGGEMVEVAFERTATRIEATIQDRVYSLEASAIRPGVLWLNWNQQSIEVSVLPDGESYSVSIGGYRIPVEILDAHKKLQRTAHRSDSGVSEIRSPMPGKIVRVLAIEGGEVESHQGIVVMEAMKMQNEIKTPISGRIRKLAVVEGETVGSGDLIAIVEALPGLHEP